MRILVTKDSSSKIALEITDWAEADCLVNQGFHVEQLCDDGSTAPLPEKQIPIDPAEVAELKTAQRTVIEESAFAGTEVVAAPAPAPAKKTAKPVAKKSAPAKKVAAKSR